MRLLRSLVALLLVLGPTACGDDDDGSSRGQIVGAWADVQTQTHEGGALEKRETYLILDADGTHRWLGKLTVTVGSTSTSIDGPCGSGTYSLGERLSMRTDYVRYDGAGTTTETKNESFEVSLDGDTLVLGSATFQRSAAPAADEYCP